MGLDHICLFLVAVATGKVVSKQGHLGWDQPFSKFSNSSVPWNFTPEVPGEEETPVALILLFSFQSVSSTAPDDDIMVCPVRALYFLQNGIKEIPNGDHLQLFQLPSGAKTTVAEISKWLIQDYMSA